MSQGLFKGVALGVFSLVCSWSVSAQDLIMPTPFGDRNPPTQVAYGFAEDVMTNTQGNLRLLVKSNGTVLAHSAIPGAIMSGQVKIGEFLLSNLDQHDSVYQHDMIPLLATNYKDAQLLWNAAKNDTQKHLDKLGLKYLYVVPWTPYSVFSTRPINTLADFKGQSIRAFNKTVTNLIESVKAKPVQIPLNAVKGAFLEKKLTARFVSLSVAEDTQAGTYAPYLTDLRAWIPKEIVVMNKAAFMALDTNTQTALLNAAAKAEQRGWLLSQQRVQTDLASLAYGGVKYSAPSPELLKSLEPISQRMIQQWIQQNPKQNEAIYKAYRSAQKAAQ